MIELNKADRNGYITSGLDLTVRARTVNGQIVCFNVEPEGTKATYLGKELSVPAELSKIDKIVDLLAVLKTCGLNLSEDKLEIAGNASQTQNNLITRENSVGACSTDVSPCSGYACSSYSCGNNSSPCAGDGCLTNACASEVAPCAGDGCVTNMCGSDIEPCAGNGCAINMCAAEVAPCAADGCVTNMCASDMGPCAGNGCAANMCVSDVGPCVAHGCADNGCLVDASSGCPLDGQVGPCTIDLPFCPVIL